MRLYLSSYLFGHAFEEEILNLVPQKAHIAICHNARDAAPLEERLETASNPKQYAPFEKMGFTHEELDLRHFIDNAHALQAHLSRFDMLWVRGGNVFTLRRAFYHSGLDHILPPMLENDEIAYGGFSAGCCVLSPSLKGYELVDPPQEHVTGYTPDILWDGLGILDEQFVPHYMSDHPEAEAVDDAIAFYQKENIPYRTLRDGDALSYITLPES